MIQLRSLKFLHSLSDCRIVEEFHLYLCTLLSVILYKNLKNNQFIAEF